MPYPAAHDYERLEIVTVDELRAILGEGWAIAPKTKANLARYKRCITRKQYYAACEEVYANRLKTETPEATSVRVRIAKTANGRKNGAAA